jgi:hypothetical protein
MEDLEDPTSAAQLYLVDFGLSREAEADTDGQIQNGASEIEINGNAHFMSLNAINNISKVIP